MKTTGSTIVVPARGRGGLYYNINPLDLEIAQFRDIDLWLDGKSLVSRLPMVAASRTDGGNISAPDATSSPNLFNSTNSFDGPGFVFNRASNQRLEANEYVIGQSYAMIAVVSFVDGAGGVNGIFGHIDDAGNRVKFWASQVAAGDPFTLALNHASGGAQSTGQVDAASSGVVAGTRYILWVTYNALTQRVDFGRGNTWLKGSTIAFLPKTQAGMGIGSTGNSAQSASGRIDALFGMPTSLYNPFADHAANRTRADLISLISQRYDVAA